MVSVVPEMICKHMRIVRVHANAFVYRASERVHLFIINPSSPWYMLSKNRGCDSNNLFLTTESNACLCLAFSILPTNFVRYLMCFCFQRIWHILTVPKFPMSTFIGIMSKFHLENPDCIIIWIYRRYYKGITVHCFSFFFFKWKCCHYFSNF